MSSSTTSTSTGSTPAPAGTRSGRISPARAEALADWVCEMMLRPNPVVRRDRAFVVNSTYFRSHTTDLERVFVDHVVRRCEIELARAEGKPVFKRGDRVQVIANTRGSHHLKIGGTATVDDDDPQPRGDDSYRIWVIGQRQGNPVQLIHQLVSESDLQLLLPEVYGDESS